MLETLARLSKIRLLLSAIFCVILGAVGMGLSVYTCAGSLAPYEEVHSLNHMNNSELTDGKVITGSAYKPIAQYSADFGDGKRSYVIMALDTFEKIQNIHDKTKEVYVSVDIKAAGDHSESWWDSEIKSEANRNHGVRDTFYLECKLKSIPGDYSMSNIYKLTGSSVPSSRIIPYYAEPYQINENAVHEKVNVFPVWYGLGLFAVGAALFLIYFFRYGRRNY